MKRKSILQQLRRQRHSLGMTSLVLTSMMLYSPASYAVYTYIFGNHVKVAQSGPGPTTDGLGTAAYPSGPTVYFTRTDSLAPANVALRWDNGHGAATVDNADLYCTRSDQGTGTNSLSVESSYISAGHYNGVEIFKTNITGLYFSLNLRSFNTSGLAKVSVTDYNITSGVAQNAITLSDTGAGKCDGSHIEGEATYTNWGGLSFYSMITFYTDQSYTPGPSSVTLLKTAEYDFRMWNPNPGPGIKSFYKNVVYDISSVIVAEPTCSTQPVASGSSVNGATADLGHYSPNSIINGVAAVPFSIQLANCRGLRNINVTLTTSTPASDPTLLGNILSLNNATGVGVEIRGAANNYSPQTLMIPNNSTSIYNDQRNTSSDKNIYGPNEPGVAQSQTLNFLATLKRDSNQKIGSGSFKANGTFTFDYP